MKRKFHVRFGGGPSEKCPQVGQLAGGLPYEEEAFRYGVDPDVSREELEALIEASASQMPITAHRTNHSEAGDFARLGRSGGLRTLALYGRG